MSPFRPPRARGFSYIGLHRYFLTICASQRRPVFTEVAAGRWIIDLLMPIAREEQFAMIAYCAMPDHVHIVAEGDSEVADLRALVGRWKQITGHAWRQRRGHRLWQEGFYDHVLRDDEDLAAVVRYVLNNPVRAGLVKSPAEYPLLGSDRYELSSLADLVRDWHPPYSRRAKAPASTGEDAHTPYSRRA